MRHTLFELPAANLVVKVTTAAEIQIQNNDPFRPIIRIIKPYADLDNAEPGKAARTVLIVYSVSCGRANFNAWTPAPLPSRRTGRRSGSRMRLRRCVVHAQGDW